MDRNSPIGILDSGVGGLSVLPRLINLLPNERFVYIGDNARFPYGDKKPSWLRQTSLELGEFLVKKGVKAIVIACGTLSSHAVELTAREFRLPVFGVIEPTIRELNKHKGKRTIVWATPATIESGAYQDRLSKRGEQVKYIPSSLAASVENGQLLNIPSLDGDVIVLGCTHYSWLNLNSPVVKIGSARELAFEVKARLGDEGLLAKEHQGESSFYFTGDIQKPQQKLDRLFMGKAVAKLINLKEEVYVSHSRQTSGSTYSW